MLCLVCNTRPAPPETGLCKACDHGFHPINSRPLFSDQEIEFVLDWWEAGLIPFAFPTKEKVYAQST